MNDNPMNPNSASPARTFLCLLTACALVLLALFAIDRYRHGGRAFRSGPMLTQQEQVDQLHALDKSPSSISDLPSSGDSLAVAYIFQIPGVLEVEGIPQDDPTDVLRLPRFHPPQSPEQIKVTLWTDDGKKWNAVWQPADN